MPDRVANGDRCRVVAGTHKGKAGTVIKQAKKPKTTLKAGSKVNVTVKK